MKEEQASNGMSEDTRASGSGGFSKDVTSVHDPPELLTSLGFTENNKCTRQRATQINMKLANFFHYNALPFNLVESEEFGDFVRELCPAYYQKGIPGRFWMETTGVDLVYHEIHEQVEQHLGSCDALMVNMDGWENEKKQQLKIISETGTTMSRYSAVIVCLMFINTFNNFKT
jgi:hypothetical protein